MSQRTVYVRKRILFSPQVCSSGLDAACAERETKLGAKKSVFFKRSRRKKYETVNVCDKVSDKGAWLVLLTVVHLSARLFSL